MYETYHEEDVDKPYPEKTAAPRNITNNGPPNNGVPRQTGTEDVARRPAVPDAASVKGEPNMQDRTYTHSIDVPGAAANNNFNTTSPKDGQTNCMADKSETKKIAMPAITSEERGAGGITKCAPTCVPGNFATPKLHSLPLHRQLWSG